MSVEKRAGAVKIARIWAQTPIAEDSKGKNGGKMLDEYFCKYSSFPKKGTETSRQWCRWFCSSVAGYVDSQIKSSPKRWGDGNTGSSCFQRDTLKKLGSKCGKNSTPFTGTVICWGESGKGHAGLVLSVQGSGKNATLTIAEGNTSQGRPDRDGGQTCIKTYSNGAWLFHGDKPYVGFSLLWDEDLESLEKYPNTLPESNIKNYVTMTPKEAGDVVAYKDPVSKKVIKHNPNATQNYASASTGNSSRVTSADKGKSKEEMLRKLKNDIDETVERLKGGGSKDFANLKTSENLSEKTKNVELKQISVPKQESIKNSTFYINNINNPDKDVTPEMAEVKDNTKTDVQTRDLIHITGNYL